MGHDLSLSARGLAPNSPANVKVSGSESTPIAKRIREIRERLVNRIWTGLLIIALIGAPVSALRSINTGWLNIYSAHIAIALVVVAVYFLRHHLSIALKTAIIMLLFWAVGLAGVMTFGMLGAGVWWLVMSSLLMSTLYSLRAGLMTIGAVVLAVVAAGTAFSKGWLKVAVDANAYIETPLAWMTLLVATALMPLIVFQAISMLQRTTLRLLREVEDQRQQIEHIATHDALCGIPTRHLALDRLGQALQAMARTRRKVAVLFIDLDGFKPINDSYGHEAGDTVLVKLSQRLVADLRATDTVARMGGDEFIAILNDIHSTDEAMSIAGKLIVSIREPIRHGENQLFVGASIGVALSPDHAQSAEALIQVADAAMYHAKRKGKNQAWLATQTCMGARGASR